MHNLTDDAYLRQRTAVLPWLQKSEADWSEQPTVQAVLTRRAGASFGKSCFVANDACIFTSKLVLGDGSCIASGAVLRGDVSIGAECSINPYAHIVGKVTIGRGCRIAALASIYGFNHGFDRTDLMIKDQPSTSVGVTLEDDVWVGANAVICDGVTIGAHSVVAAGAVVTKSFEPFTVIGGNPARVLRDRRDISAEEGHSTRIVSNQIHTVRKLLHKTDPYVDLRHVYPEDMQGWGSQDPMFREAICRLRPAMIVEVGTWKGASAIHMADVCAEIGLQSEIVCIDTWLGNWQHWSRTEGIGSRTDLQMVNGFPTLYYQFLSNVISKGHQNTITPLPLTGVAAAKLFAAYKLRPNLIYIDGDHEYESVIGDLRGWLALMDPGGVLLGDDYDFPGVKQAVDEMSADQTYLCSVSGRKFEFRYRRQQIA
jgi:acetyltransferase-like isoleucine patch superfamily enzyme